MKPFSLLKLIRYVLCLLVCYIAHTPVSMATITGVSELYTDTAHTCVHYNGNAVNLWTSDHPYFSSGNCSYSVNGYVASGNYVMMYRAGNSRGVISNPLYISSSTNLGSQTVHFTGNGRVNIPNWGPTGVAICLYLKNNDTGQQYTVVMSNMQDGICDSNSPKPSPTPVPDPTSCSINNSNTLTVDLGTIERAQLPTDPAAGSASEKTIPVPVNCTGGSVSAKMNLSYTAITVAGKSVVKSSSNGLGVGILYNDQVLAPNANTPMQFNKGSNQFDLSFIAVRDPAVTLADVPAGAFSASATLIMTQQ